MFILLAALLPVAILLFYIYRKDPQPEPVSALARAVLYGALMVVPILVIEVVVSMLLFGGGRPINFVDSMLQAFLVAAVPEECFKLLALWLVTRRNPYFDEHFDGIVYAVCVSLGFAAVENINYVFSDPDSWQMTAVLRGLLAVPGHYGFGIIMGYFYSVYHFVDRSTRARVLVLLMPILGHGIYDTIAMSGAVNPYIQGVAFMILVAFCIKMHRFAYDKIKTQIARDSVAQRGEDYETDYTPYVEEDRNAGCLGVVCSILFPLVGIVLYFTQRKSVDNPSAYLWAALVGFILGVMLRSAVAG